MYQVGDLPHFHNAFRDPHNGQLVDPATVRFRWKTPADVETTWIYGTDPELTKDSVGLYTAAVDLNAPGVWRFRWETGGTHQGADEFALTVEASSFT